MPKRRPTTRRRRSYTTRPCPTCGRKRPNWGPLLTLLFLIIALSVATAAATIAILIGALQ